MSDYTFKHEQKNYSYEPPKDEYYKAKIETLEKENARLKNDLEKRAEWYGLGKDMFDQRMKEMSEENERLHERVIKLEQALVREAIRDVSV